MSINTVTIIGNLTRDPELRGLPSGGSVCLLRVAVNDRVKQGEQWVDRPSFLNVTVWGKMGENCARHLSKGRQVGVQGSLRWSEWDDKDTGKKREKVEINAREVQFLGGGAGGQNGGGGGAEGGFDGGAGQSGGFDGGDLPSSGGADDDIPF